MKNNLISPYENWRAMALLEGKTLGEVLRIRRKDMTGKPEFMSVIAMGQALKDKYNGNGRTGTWITNLEYDRSDLMTLQPEVRLYLLQLYASGLSPAA